MPVSFPPVRPYPGTYRTLGTAARDNLLIALRCNGCHRTVNFLAADLAEVLGKDPYAHVPPFPCSRCGTDDYIDVRVKSPRAGDIGHLIVRRPVRAGTVTSWRNVPLPPSRGQGSRHAPQTTIFQ